MAAKVPVKGNAPAAKAPVAKPVVKAAPAKVEAPKPVVEAAKVVAEAPAKVAETVAKVVAPVAEKIVETPVAVAAPIIKEAKAMNDTVKKVAAETNDRAQAMFGDFNTRAKDAADKSAKLFEEFNDFARGNVEALVESSKIAAKGAEDIAKYSADYGRQAIERGNETAKRFASIKSPTELFQLQSELLKGAVDSMVAETSKFSESYLKLVGEVVQPISNRVSVAAEKVKVAA